MISPICEQAAALLIEIDRTILAPNHGCVAAGARRTKADASLVTHFDQLSESALQALSDITPGALVVGEEAIDTDPGAFERLAHSEKVWVVDPIDGTGAFARGEPLYAIVAVLIEAGRSTHAVIFNPGISRVPGQESRPPRPFLVQATLGAGCYLNGKRVSLTRRPASMRDARVSFACRNQHQRFEPVLAERVMNYLPRGTAAHDYATLLAGDRDAVFYSEGYSPEGYGKCPPWDHAAGVLCIQEAGGVAGVPHAAEPVPYDPRQRYDQVLIAANPPLWREIYQHVKSRVPELVTPRRAA
jgi:fructose-1,6-bisphosphatase/inositol monophosphatase family enzyme